MKRAFSLIEMIFVIVIMAGIFSVIPKIILVSNKSDTFALKQDALFNAISLTKITSLMSWDENSTDKFDILSTFGDTNFTCNPTGSRHRVGSFTSINARECSSTTDINASIIGSDTNESDYLSFDDIDDYNGSIIEANISSINRYTLYPNIVYLTDNHTDVFTLSSDKKTMIIDLSKSTTSYTSTNIKKIKITVGYTAGRGKDRNITSFNYYTTNIGQFFLGKVVW